jgi:hypothetical protein
MARRRAASETCPHCKREILQHRLDTHKAICPMNPDIAAAMTEALTGADGYAITRTEYEATMTVDAGLPSRSLLNKMLGNWPAICAQYCVPMHPEPVVCVEVEPQQEPPLRKRHSRRDDAQEISPMTQAEIDAEVVATMHVSRAALDAARYCTRQGMPVATHQDGTPYARTVAGGGVAYMLR